MIHDEARSRANQGRRARTTGRRSEYGSSNQPRPLRPRETARLKEKTTAKTFPLTTCAFIHDVSPYSRCRAPCFCCCSARMPEGSLRHSKAAPEGTACHCSGLGNKTSGDESQKLRGCPFSKDRRKENPEDRRDIDATDVPPLPRLRLLFQRTSSSRLTHSPHRPGTGHTYH